MWGTSLGRRMRRRNLIRLFKNTRGVSETVALLLTAIIVVSAGATSLAFAMGFLQQSTTTFRTTILQDTAALQERFTVVDVWFAGDDDEVRVGVFNYGDVPIEVDTIFLNNNLFRNFAPAEKFQPQEFRYVELDLSQSLQTGEFVVRVVTTEGTVHESTWKA